MEVVVEATLIHIIDDSTVLPCLLLQRKSAGLFGEGKWNGVGGKLKAREIPVKGAAREALEETELRVSNLKPHGVLDFYFGQRAKADWIVHVFSTSTFEGELKPSEEGVLRWFPLNEIPYDEMWQGDKHWLPLLLGGRLFGGEFYFNKDGTKLMDYDLRVEPN